MTKQRKIPRKDWGKILDACLNTDRIFLLFAINAALEQNNRPRIDTDAAVHISQEALARIAFDLAKKTAIIEKNGTLFRIDPLGKYRLSFK